MSGRLDTDGVVSEYWDMDSSQASNQLENIGRFAAESHELMDYAEGSSSMLLDSQVMMISNPA